MAERTEEQTPGGSQDDNRESAPSNVRYEAYDRRHGAPERLQLGVISFGIALGLTIAIFAFCMALMTALTGWGIGVVQVLSTLYIGYEPSLVGAIAGAVWGFVDGFIGGIVWAWIYNRLIARRPR